MKKWMKQTVKQLLTQAKIDVTEAEILLAYVLAKPREFVISHHTDVVSFWNRKKFFRLVKKRKAGVPIAYITGTKEFYGLDFEVNKYTLVPRPDTEIMIETVLEMLKNKKDVTLIDIGTGSGCIPISILNNTDAIKKSFATDISSGAIKTAKKNAKRHNVNIDFRKMHLSAGLTPHFEGTLILTANLPYLTEDQWKSEPSIQQEPKSALVAENNGLALYDELLSQLHSKKEMNMTCLFEIDPTQTSALKNIIQEHFPNTHIEVKKDLAKRDRVVMFSVYS
jgi:release factor glutamine methyltransferase